MKQLDMLMASENQITDISPLAGLPLTRLYLNNNPITDYSPIAGIYDTLVEKDFEILSADDIPDEPLVFDDPQFEKALRAAMGIAEGPITQRDAYIVQSLEICNDKTEGSAFSDISPLQYFVNLKSLYFNSNLISDLTPLSGLTKLTNLDICFNQVADLTPLSGLKQLESLKLNNNQITDVSALADLTNLRELWIADNPIADYSPIADIYPKLTSKDFEMN
jgi:internalin A